MTAKVDIAPAAQQNVATDLARFLANTYILYVKTQNFHWNVTGPQFPALHTLFEQQYQDLAAATDEIAERIRALGEIAPGSLAQFSRLAFLQETTSAPLAEDMLRQLVADHEIMVREGRRWLASAQKAGDEVTADLYIERLAAHEKAMWMLKSSI